MRYRSIFALAFLGVVFLPASASDTPATVPPEIYADLDQVSTALKTVWDGYYVDLCNANSGYSLRRG